VAILLSLQLVEDLPEAIRRIQRAQRSRGLRLDGSLAARWRGLRYLVTPVVMRTLEGSLERATALQMRGLLNPISEVPALRPFGGVGVGLVVLALLLLCLKILQWFELLPSIV
jgi:energy-coupling factor transporter transmembrane protein EcfT